VFLIVLSFSLASATGIILLYLHRRHQRQLESFGPDRNPEPVFPHTPALHHHFMHRPVSWMAVRSRNLQSVQQALGLSHPEPCTWIEGLSGEKRLFIAPSVNGWIVITGSGLPDPADDVDGCFRFLLDLSGKLGQVQFFCANRVLAHHAWVRAESGRIIRAYAWAGKTLWNQGIKSVAELELGMKCFRYFEAPENALFGQQDVNLMNTEKVALLAARWSLDPAAIDERSLHSVGIAGEPTRLY
jgi:hypothetical protein